MVNAPGRHRIGGVRGALTGVPALVVVVAVVVIALVLSVVQPTRSAYTAQTSNRSNANTAGYALTSMPFRDSFAGGQGAWKTYGGTWQTQTTNEYGTFLETSGSSDGPKAITGSESWSDYTMQADVQVNSGTNAGLLVRVTSPTTGTDALTGYYVGLGKTGGTLFISRMNNGSYLKLSEATIPGGITYGQFYHVVVQVSGCGIAAWSTTIGANSWTKTNVTEDTSTCLTTGAVGLRGNGSAAGYRFVTVTQGALPASTASDPYNSTLTTGRFEDGTAARVYGGTWAPDADRNVIGSTAYSGNGDKQVLNRVWGDMTLTGDVKLKRSPNASIDAGYNVRVNDPSTGLDALRGYYVGINANQLLIGEHRNPDWLPGATVALGRTVQVGEWWHITVEAVGCTITATASPSSGGTPVSVSKTYTGCSLTTGAVGIREQGLEAEWRNIAVTPR